MNRGRYLVLVLLLAPIGTRGDEKSVQALPKNQQKRIESLIDRLVDTAESDFGYSPTVTGQVFLPVDSEGQFAVGMLFQRPPVPSQSMRELVKQGAAAVPQLLEHLTDKRRTRIFIRQGPGMFWIHEDPGKNGAKKDMDAPPPLVPRHMGHTITVGDLCYVALGQILSRPYNAVRYIPSGNIAIMSPTHAPSIAKDLRAEWRGLTPAKHRAALITDLLQRDSDYLRSAAAKRLAYYYPEALGEPVLKLLRQPVYDVFTSERFVREELYKAKDPKTARQRFDAFLKEEGEAYRYGIELQLFGDLETLEADEQGRLSPRLKDFRDQPRRLLIQLYHKGKAVTSKERPKAQDIWNDADLVPFLTEGLSYDDTPAVDAPVRDLLRRTKIDWVAAACTQHLIGRGFDGEIGTYLQTRAGRTDLQDAAKLFHAKQGWTRLHLAVENKHIEHVRRWIAGKKDVNVSARSGETPLHLAAAAGSSDIVALLLAAKARVDEKNKGGQTALGLAVRNDNLDTARLLLAAGATPPDILAAALAGREDLAERFVDHDKAAVRKTTEQQWSPLHLSAWAGKPAVAALLLRHGAATDLADKNGWWTPLHVAAYRGHDQVVRVLLDHKANVNAETAAGQQALALAVQAGRLATAKILVAEKASPKATSSDQDYSLMHVAASEGHPECLAWLLTLGLPIDGRDTQGHTPLHFAAKFGRANCVEYLLQHKADVNATTKWDERPLALAIKAGQLNVVRILLAHKAGVAWTDAWGLSPAQLADAYDQADIAALLRRKTQPNK